MGRFETSSEDAAWYREHARHRRGLRLTLAIVVLLLVFAGGPVLRIAGSPEWARIVLLVVQVTAAIALGILLWRSFRAIVAHQDPYLRKRHPRWDSENGHRGPDEKRRR